jgi:excinuclease UvrABC nuclease subunit
MSGIKGHDYTWSKSWIEFKAPNAPGVYCLRDKEGKVLFIGKGKVLERLLSHWNRENSTDEAIWDHAPATFQFELTTHPAEREAGC